MKTCLLALSIFFIFTTTFAQLPGRNIGLLGDEKGILLRTNRYDGVQGTPYLNKAWQTGLLKVSAEKSFRLSKMRFNALQNQVEYQYLENVYEPTTEFDEFVLNDRNDDGQTQDRFFRKGFAAIDENTDKTFYEILHDGKAKLLAKTFVRITEYAEPLSTNRVKRFAKVPVLYLYLPTTNQLIKLKKDKKSVLAAFNYSTDALNQFVSDKRLKLKSEKEIIELCRHYDELANSPQTTNQKP